MKLIYVLITILLISIRGYSQDIKVYDGLIDKYPIKVFLNFNKDRVTGHYLYTKAGQPIYLEGERKNNTITLNEILKENGSWGDNGAKLTWTDVNNPTGKWTNKDKTFTISLTRRKLEQEWILLNANLELTHNFSDSTTSKFPISVSIVYPTIESDKLLFQLLLSQIFNIKNNNYHNFWGYFNQFTLKYFEEYLSDFAQDIHPYYEFSMHGSLVYLSDSIMTYSTSGMGYSGGAQGYGFTNYHVFNLKKYSKVTFNDIFKEGSEIKVSQLIYEKSDRKHDIETVKRHLNNFYITNKGVGFFFGQDTLDCHACGVYEYFFTFTELKNELR